MATDSPESFVRDLSLFATLDPGELTEVVRLLRRVRLPPGQVLFREGDAAGTLWILGRGAEVSVVRESTPGRPASVVARLRAGDTLGELSLLESGRHTCDAVTTRGGDAFVMGAPAFAQLRRERRPVGYKVLRRLCEDICRRLRATDEQAAVTHLALPPVPPVPCAGKASGYDLLPFASLMALTTADRELLLSKMDAVELKGVAPLFSEGQPADAAYLLVNGQVALGQHGTTRGVVGHGALVGIVSALDRGPRASSAVSRGNTRLLRLTRRAFDELFDGGSAGAFELLELALPQLVWRLRSSTHQLTNAVVLPDAPRLPSAVAMVPARTSPSGELLS